MSTMKIRKLIKLIESDGGFCIAKKEATDNTGILSSLVW